MEIVINIPEATYAATCEGNMLPPDVKNVVEAIKNGIPLPKHHGRIIDESQISRIEFHTERELYGDKIRYVKVTDAPTIIEANKGVLEKIKEKQNSQKATCKVWEEVISQNGYDYKIIKEKSADEDSD